MISIIYRAWTARRLVIAAAVAFLFMLQAISVGVATGAASGGGDSGLLSLICATQKVSKSNGDTPAPAAPHAGVCCLLHCAAFKVPDAAPVYKIVLASQLLVFVLSPLYCLDAVVIGPEMDPLAPRAPPQHYA
jgi:hypothetical protein